jgi:large subunit ribosomal protein L15
MPLTLDDLRPNPGSNKTSKRVGRGHGSGKGKTAGRGTKGQKARSGPGPGRGFEGGQLPIQKRMPYKRGFTNIFKTPWEVVNLRALATVEGEVTPEALHAAGLTRGLEFPVKILGVGEAPQGLTVRAHAFSKTAREAIEAAGGTAEVLERTDDWVTAKPRSRRVSLPKDVKKLGVGKVGGPKRREALASVGAGAAEEA